MSALCLTNKARKLIELCQISGLHHPDAVLALANEDGIILGICRNPECSHVAEVSRFERGGLCPLCSDNTVQSVLVLAGGSS